MGIDKIIALTLERSSKRQDAFTGALTALQTPTERICFLRGHDNLDFDDDIGLVAQAADKDGFSFIYNFANKFVNEFTQQTAAAVCQIWNYVRALRHIANGNETCLILWDDRTLTVPFPFMDKMVTELQARDDFYLFQTRCRYSIGRLLPDTNGDYFCPDPAIDWFRIALEYPDLVSEKVLPPTIEYQEFVKRCTAAWVKNYQKFIHSHYHQGKMAMPIEKYVDAYLKTGMMGLEENMVFSPQGAAWLLREILNIKELDGETLENSRIKKYADNVTKLFFEHHKQENPHSVSVLEDFRPDWAEDLKAVFPALDCWIYSILDFDKAVSEGKGIYCPKRLEYSYINDWFPMGSDIEWTVDAGWDEKRVMSTEIPFLEIQ